MRILRVLKGVAVSAMTWALAWTPITIGLTADRVGSCAQR